MLTALRQLEIVIQIAVFLPSLLLAQGPASRSAPPHLARAKVRVLLIDGQNNHAWQRTTPVLTTILERSGRFTVRVATAKDVATFRPSFTDCDVVLLNYNGPPWPQETREGFLAFVRAGGGAVVVHAADNAFPHWKEYNRLIGLGGWGQRDEQSGPYIRWRSGKFVRDTTPGRGGSHGTQHEFVIEVRAPDHPILRGLPRRWRHTRDELYDRLRGPAEHLTVLATAFSAKAMRGTGEHEPILMTIRYGKGRVFHTTLGHDLPALRGLGFQMTLARGTEWAATGTVTLPPVDAAALSAEVATQRAPESIEPGWISLFDGKTLKGWSQRNGTAKYSVEAGTGPGVILGTTTDGSPNSFLCTDESYDDFELRFEVRLDDALNSGVQIRSATRGAATGRVHGPQVEIAANGTAGFLYGEALGTGWLSKDRSDPAKQRAFRKGAWNRYRVLAKGKRIRTWVNGTPVADLDDPSGMRRGFVGLQVHAVPAGRPPLHVRWRRLFLRRTKPTPKK